MIRKKCYLVQFIIIAIVILTGFKSYAGNDEQSRPGDNAGERPNFIFIMADDLGWGDLGVYGHPVIKTPNLDRIAMEGLLFTQFYVNSPTLSGSSRFAFMTGIFPAEKGVHMMFPRDPYRNSKLPMPEYLDPRITTISKLLKNAGYTMAHYGQWQLGRSPDAPEPSAYGFDDSYVMGGNGPGWQIKRLKGKKKFQSESSKRIIDKGIRFIEINLDRPFYLNLWLSDPHLPLAPTREQVKPYKRTTILEDARDYYAVVTNMDRQIGRLLKRLKELELESKTVIIFSSDNGPSLMGKGSAGPFRGLRSSLYEGSVRVPFIVYWPGKAPAGKIDDTTVLSAVDFLPSIAGLAGIKLSDDLKIDGENMSQAILGKPQKRAKPLFWYDPFYRGVVQRNGEIVHKSPMLAVRDGKWKLLMNHDRSRIELYDIIKGPTELDNIAAMNPEIVGDLSKKLDEWYDTLPVKQVDKNAGSNDYPWPGYELYRKLEGKSEGK